jgi:pSer/pThr/pTyr-binding forkhead associated (FHA) protein
MLRSTLGNNIVDSPIKSLVLGMIPRLVAICGPCSHRTFYLDEPTVSIGRQPSNDISLDDPYVSRNHCLIRNEGDEYMLEDLNSANGTYVDDARVKGSAHLREGSLIQIGNSLFVFKLQNHNESMALSGNRAEFEQGRSPFEEIRIG